MNNHQMTLRGDLTIDVESSSEATAEMLIETAFDPTKPTDCMAGLKVTTEGGIELTIKGFALLEILDVFAMGQPAPTFVGNPIAEPNPDDITAAVDALKMARQCVDFCRKNHPNPQAGDGIPVEMFIDDVIKRLGG